ncbi:MAG: metalloregulator ArsR/SmtB family transcription factor [Sphingomonas sp.]
MSAIPDPDDAADLLRVLGHGVRLRLMTALVEGERSVGDLEMVTGTGQPMLSQQLGILRKAALVKTRREAKQVFYRLDRDRMRDVSALIDRFAGTVAVAGDRNVDQRRQRGGSAAMFAKIG